MEPFGERGAWHRAALIAATLVNLAPKKKGAARQLVEAERFMPKFDAILAGRRAPLDPERVREVIAGAARAAAAPRRPAAKGAR